MAFNNEPTDEEFFSALQSEQRSRQSSSNAGTGESFTVYNPVDDSFEGWPTGIVEDLPRSDSMSNVEENKDTFNDNSQLIPDGRDGTLAVPNSPLRNEHADTDVSDTINESPDDALARQIAEQDLPPGVSAVEQQEIMMRLLTQQLRRGDDAEREVSPELEQRLRE